MLYIDNITSNPNQTLNISIETKETIILNLRFLPTQLTWQGSLTYSTFPTFRFNVVNTVNLLHPWRNLLSFGIMCVSEDKIDPFQITDFSSINSNVPRNSLYILNTSDLLYFNNIAYGY